MGLRPQAICSAAHWQPAISTQMDPATWQLARRAKPLAGNANAGAVNVIYGSRIGIESGEQSTLDSGFQRRARHSNAAAQFGFALATGDFNEIAGPIWQLEHRAKIFQPSEMQVATNNAGAVHILLGSSARLTSTNNQILAREC